MIRRLFSAMALMLCAAGTPVIAVEPAPSLAPQIVPMPLVPPSIEPLIEVEGPYLPHDLCKSMPGATSFRAALADAVFVQKVEALVALAAPDVKLDFGDGAGRDELRRRLTGPRGPELWRALRTMLPLGCAVDGKNIVLPWFFKQDLGVEDPFDVLLVAGTRVRLLDAPAHEAAPTAVLSWTLVKPVEGYDPAQRFQKVEVLDPKVTGYVYTNSLRSQLDYRLIARPAGLRWEIEAFIAGD